MHKHSQSSKKNAGLVGAIFGGVLIVPATPLAALAVPSPVSNPCPRIFYEEPHNQRVLVPQGCPPNAITQQQRSQEVTPVGIGGPTDTPTTASPVLNPRRAFLTNRPTTALTRLQLLLVFRQHCQL